MSMENGDTIVAIATAAGPAALGMIRVSGPEAKRLLGQIFLPCSPRFSNFKPWLLHHGKVLDETGETLDDCLAVYMPGPNTYTGENACEIHCHGNPVILQAVLRHLIALGARLATPGEFTRRAFLHGRLDLAQAEAVADLVSAPGRKGLKIGLDRLEGRLSKKISALIAQIEEARLLVTASLDFNEEETGLEATAALPVIRQIMAGLEALLAHSRQAEMLVRGVKIVLAGPVNAGKSTLLNYLCGRERALVTSQPGTTRDFLEVEANFDGIKATLVDTAGLRENPEEIEALGIAKSLQQAEDADLIALILDCSRPEAQAQPELLEKIAANGQRAVIIWNKSDLGQPGEPPIEAGLAPVNVVSCATGENLESLRPFLLNALLAGKMEALQDDGASPNLRQSLHVEAALKELDRMLKGFGDGTPLDCLATHLDVAAKELSEILGLQADEAVLDQIFSTFCIGK